MQEEEDIVEFWQELEQEIGEKVEWYSLGELLAPFDNLSKNTVGMFFLTPSSFYFQTFPRNDFLRVLANSFRKNKKDGGRIQQDYPRSGLLSAEVVRPRGLLRRAFSSNMPEIVLRFSDEVLSGGPAAMRFTLLDAKAGDELMGKIAMEPRNGADS